MKAKVRVPKKTATKMLNIPFCAYLVQISTTFFRSEDRYRDQVADKEERLDEGEGQGSEEDCDEDVEHSFLRVLGADLYYLFAVGDRCFLRALEMDVGLDELHGAIGAGGH